jgi:hypothetical protein
MKLKLENLDKLLRDCLIKSIRREQMVMRRIRKMRKLKQLRKNMKSLRNLRNNKLLKKLQKLLRFNLLHHHKNRFLKRLVILKT